MKTLKYIFSIKKSLKGQHLLYLFIFLLIFGYVSILGIQIEDQTGKQIFIILKSVFLALKKMLLCSVYKRGGERKDGQKMRRGEQIKLGLTL